MLMFTVRALEKFVVATVYRNVEAANEKEAVKRCKAGKEAYDSHEIQEGDEQWLKTILVEKE